MERDANIDIHHSRFRMQGKEFICHDHAYLGERVEPWYWSSRISCQGWQKSYYAWSRHFEVRKPWCEDKEDSKKLRHIIIVFLLDGDVISNRVRRLDTQSGRHAHAKFDFERRGNDARLKNPEPEEICTLRDLFWNSLAIYRVVLRFRGKRAQVHAKYSGRLSLNQARNHAMTWM